MKIYSSKMAIVLLVLITSIQVALAQPYQVEVRFFNDQDYPLDDPYINEWLWVYLQNKTPVGGGFLGSYNYTCYYAEYTNGLANITVNEGTYYDLLITDGAVTWNNETHCPNKVENYEIWATVQSEIPIFGDEQLQYWINVTMTEAPRQYFFNIISYRTLITILWFIATGAIIVYIEYWFIQNNQKPSGILAILIFVISILVKLALGV